MTNLPFIILVSILIYCKRSLAVLSISIHFKVFHSTQSIYNHIYSTTTENMSSLTKSPSFLQNKKKWIGIQSQKKNILIISATPCMQGFSAETQGRRQPDVTLSSIHQIPFRDCLVCGKGEGPLFFQSCV